MGREGSVVLYLGLDPSSYQKRLGGREDLQHIPMIATKRRPLRELTPSFQKLPCYQNLILTSQQAARYFFATAKELQLSWEDALLVVVGKATQALCHRYAPKASVVVAKEETQEGVIALLQEQKITRCFWPKSSRARLLLQQFLERKEREDSCLFSLYDTLLLSPELPLEKASRAVFSSPSTVDAFFALHPQPKKDLALEALGPITWQRLLSKYPGRSIFKAF